jgi:hypothetical protein
MQAHRPVEYFGITSFWASVPIPAPVDHGMKILIRTAQIVVHERNGESISYLVGDLDRLLAERAPEPEYQFVDVAAAGLLGATFTKNDPVRATRYLMQGIQSSRGRQIPAEIAGAVDLRGQLLEQLWMTSVSLKDNDQFELWFASVQDLTEEEAQQWAMLPYAAKGSELVCTRIWMRTAEAPASVQDWPVVVGRLDRVRSWALAAHVGPLAAHSLRAQIIVVAEYQNDLGAAVSLAQKGLAVQKSDARAQFWIAEIAARQFYYQHRPTEALTWFEQAFMTESAVDSEGRINALLIAAAAAATLSSTVSLAYLARALALVEGVGEEELPSLLVTQVWGELGIAHWSSGDEHETYIAWQRAVTELLSVKQDSDDRRILFQVMGNFTGYFAFVTQGSEQSEWTNATPEAGMLLKFPRAVLPLYNAGRDWQILAQMTLFADGVGAYDDAVKWATRIAESEGEKLAPGMDTLLQLYRLPKLLEDGRLTEIVAKAAANATADEPGVSGSDGHPPDTERAARFRERSGRLSLVVVAIELARRRLKNPEASARLASDVAEVCRAAEQRGASPWWTAAAEAIAKVAVPEAEWRSLYRQGADLIGSDAHLGMVYYLAAMLQATPENAVQLQMSVLMWLRSMFTKTLFYFTVCRLVPEFWDWALEKCTPLFGVPRLTRSRLSEANFLQGEERLRAVLRTVTEDLGVQPASAEMKRWLQADK